jgi:hypothetical protein
LERVLQSYWRKGINQDINEFLAKCDICQNIFAGNKKWTHVHTQSKSSYGSLWFIKTTENGKKYILFVPNLFSKFAELIAIPDKHAETYHRISVGLR